MRVKQLQEELDRSRATTPALAEAAARSEVERLQLELAAKQARAGCRAARGRTGCGSARRTAARLAASRARAAAPRSVADMHPASRSAIGWRCGFWLGIRHAGAARPAQIRRYQSLLILIPRPSVDLIL